MIEHTTGGQLSLAQLAAQHHTQPSTILRLTAQHSPGGAFPGNVSEYINGVFTGSIPHDQHMPAGLRLYLPSWSDPAAIARQRAVASRHWVMTVGQRLVELKVVGQRLGDMPVVPELRLAPRLAWPRIPGRATRAEAADPGLSLGGPFFRRQMCRDAARADVGGCLHESTPPRQVRPGRVVLVPALARRQRLPPARAGLFCAAVRHCQGPHSPGLEHMQPGRTATRRGLRLD